MLRDVIFVRGFGEHMVVFANVAGTTFFSPFFLSGVQFLFAHSVARPLFFARRVAAGGRHCKACVNALDAKGCSPYALVVTERPCVLGNQASDARWRTKQLLLEAKTDPGPQDRTPRSNSHSWVESV